MLNINAKVMNEERTGYIYIKCNNIRRHFCHEHFVTVNTIVMATAQLYKHYSICRQVVDELLSTYPKLFSHIKFTFDRIKQLIVNLNCRNSITKA